MILDFNTTGLRLSIPTPYPHLNFHNLLVCLGNMFSHCSLMDYLTSVGNKLFHIFIYLFWFVSCASYEDYTLDIFKSIKNKGILYRFSNKYQEVLEKTIFWKKKNLLNYPFESYFSSFRNEVFLKM